MSIEAYQDQYQADIIDLIVSIQKEEFNVAISAEDQPDLCDINTIYRQGNGNFWLAIEDEQLVGTLALLDIGNAELALKKMFVRKAYRGPTYGIAKSLIETALDWATRRNINTIYLGTIDKYKAAHRFYEKHGFVEIPKPTLPASFPVMPVDNKFYKRAIASN